MAVLRAIHNNLPAVLDARFFIFFEKSFSSYTEISAAKLGSDKITPPYEAGAERRMKGRILTPDWPVAIMSAAGVTAGPPTDT